MYILRPDEKNHARDAVYTGVSRTWGSCYQGKRSPPEYLVADGWRAQIYAPPQAADPGIWGNACESLILF